MYSLSKLGLTHKILNKNYNFLIRILFGNISWLYCLIITFEISLSNFIFKEILYGDDLKTSVRRLFWLTKISILPISNSIDLMFDFCVGLNRKELVKIKKKLNSISSKNINLINQLDLLKVIAYQIDLSNSDENRKNNQELKIQFSNQYYKVKKLINLSSQIYLEKEKNNKKNRFLKIGMNIEDARKTLIDINHFFSSIGSSWFVIAGTFLGFVREKSFLKHDLDLDIGVFESNINIDTFLKKINQYKNFKISRIEYQKEYLDKNKFIKRPIFVRLIHLNGINVDCFWHFKSKGKIYHGTNSLIWENTDFELSNYEVYDLLIKGPKDWNLYLSETYGNWKKEKKNYNYHRDMLSLKGAKNFFGIEYLLRSNLFCGRYSNSQIKSLEKLLL